MITPKDNLNLSSSKEMIDKRKKSYYKQGASTEENCRNDILLILLGGELRYRQLICRLVESEFILQNAKIEEENAENKAENLPLIPLLEKPKRFYSKQTVTHYLSHLFTEEKVTRNIPENQLSSKKPPLYLTDKGREEARKQRLINSLRELPYPTIEKVLLHYKRDILQNLKRISNKEEYSVKVSVPPNLRKLRKDGTKFVTRVQGGPFKIPEPKFTNEDNKLRNNFKFYGIRDRRTIEAIEEVLKGYHFSEEEILKLWLGTDMQGHGALIARILRFRTKYLPNKPSTEEIEDMKSSIRQNMIIRENLENGVLSNVKHPNLFP